MMDSMMRRDTGAAFCRSAGLFLWIGYSALSCGCRVPLSGSALAVHQHGSAISALPDEERAAHAPYGSPVVMEEAESLLPERLLTLWETRAIAVRANPDVHAAHARLQVALARIAQLQSQYLPTVSMTMNSSRTFMTPASRNPLGTGLQPATFVASDGDTNNLAITGLLNALRGPLFGGGARGDMNPFSKHSFALSGSWLIFNGFIREAQVLASKHLYLASADSLLDVQRLIISAVDVAYYQVQLAQEQIRIARADEVFSQEQLDETTKLRAAGRATSADVNNFRVRVLAAKATVIAAVGLRDSGRVLLAELMGIPGAILPAALSLSPLIPETKEELELPDVSAWVERALGRRPDLSQFDRIVDSEFQNVRVADGAYLPSLNASGSWGYDRTSGYRMSEDDQSAALGIELRWELYTGGRRTAQVRAAEGLRAQAIADRNRLRLAVESEVRRAIIDLRNAQEQIYLQRENLEVARESRRVIQAGYLAGKETLVRLNEAQRDFVTADADLTLARIRLRRAWSDLRTAGGLILLKPAPTP